MALKRTAKKEKNKQKWRKRKLKIEPKEISIREVAENYVDDGDGGVYGLDGELVLRPPYQREYIFGQI